MILGPLPELLAAIGRRARLLELTDEERGACYRTIALDYLRGMLLGTTQSKG